MVKPGLGWTHDPALHLIALTTAIVGAALALSSHAGPGHRGPRSEHPASCHACSVCSSEAVAARDAFLIRTGSIAPVDDGE
jgi:hypothetical protein